MTFEDLTAELGARGVKIAASEGKLRIDAPSGAITDDLRAALVEHKAALLHRCDVMTLDDIDDVTSESMPLQHANVIERERIPLSLDCTPSEWLAARGLRIVGGTPYYNGARRPVLFVAEIPPAEVAA